MATLLNVAVTTAVTAQTGSTFQLRNGPGGTAPVGISAQGTLAGTLGTNMTWWLQTSLDGGTTWCDVLAATQTAAGRFVGTSPAGVSLTPAAATDGGGTPPFAVAVSGNWWRVKYTTTGTWTAGNLRVDVETAGTFSPAGAGAS